MVYKAHLNTDSFILQNNLWLSNNNNNWKLPEKVYALGTLLSGTLQGRWHYCPLSKEVKSFAQGRGASNR